MTARDPLVVAWLDEARTRGDIKRMGARLEAEPDLRDRVIADARARGLEIDGSAAGKKLLRQVLDRSTAAQVVRTPTRLDEAFRCAHCGRDTPPHGRTARDHCPWCLRSLHVDVIPGDRAADCGGILDPIALELRHGEPIVTFVCRRCGQQKRNRAVEDGVPPDDPEQLRRLSRGERLP